MKTEFIIIASLILGLIIVISPDLARTEARRGDLLIIYSGNTLGELKPCGCAKEEDQGGIERRMGYLKAIRASTKNTLLVDTGDGFKAPTKQGKLKAEYLMKSMASMKYDAVTLGDKDTVYGNKFIGDIKNIPWVSSNIEFKGAPFSKYIIKKYEDGLKVAMITAADPGLFYTKHSSDIKVHNPIEVIKNLIDEIKKKEKPHLIVLLSHMKKEDGIKLLNVEGIDVVINGHIEDAEDIIDMKPVIKDGKAFVQPGPRGQKMGELKVTISSDGKTSFTHKMVKLDSHVKFDPEMVELYDKYNEKIEALFFASLSAKRKNKNSNVYATDLVCASCHPDEHKIWSESRHGRAYNTLIKANKSFDPECLVCHTVGFEKSGGFVSEIDTPKLKNVQCEVCHGSGVKHAESPQPGFGKKAKDACKMCHVKNHSPKFNFNDYWPRIKH
ncbi:MAG: multiheme c-type cytochrome [Nitrospinales bacterium]